MPEVAPHPHRTFQQIAASFGDKHVPGRLRRPLYNWATAAWRAAFRIDRHERRIAQDFARGLDGFHHDHWIFENFYFSEFVATTLLEADGEADPARKAAQLIRGALAFRDDVLNDRLPQEFEAGKPLDMQRYRRLFSRLALQVQRNGKDVQKMTDCAPSDYVVVAVCGLMYRLQCVEDGHSLAYEELARQLGLLLTDARSRSASSATPSGQFGLLTVLFNRKHGKLYRELMAKDRDGVEAMNRALFCVAIDLDSEPTTLDQALRASHSANYRNRDHRRSLQVVVSANGRAAVTVHPHAGIGGTYMAKLASALWMTCQELQRAPEETAGEVVRSRYRYLPLVLSGASSRDLEASDADVRRRMYRPEEPTTLRFEGVGGDAFRDRRISPDGAFHAALHLAYHRSFAKVPYTSNFINLRNVRDGDIWKYTSTSEAMRQFVHAPGARTLAAAVEAHRQLVKANKRGDEEVYQSGMSLFRLISEGHVPFAAFPALMILLSLFIPNFAKRFIGSDIWVSSIPALPGIEMMGRAGVRLSFLDKGGFAGHYMIFPDHVKVCLLSSLKQRPDAARNRRFFETLDQCLHEVKDLVEVVAPALPATA